MYGILIGLVAAGSVAHAADVAITTDGASRHVQALKYEAVVADDGCLTNLRVGGAEFLASKITRGAYFYQDGALKLPAIEQPADNAVLAKSDKASILYEFGPESMTWTATNTSQKPMEFVMVFEPSVSAVMDAAGKAYKTSVNTGWQSSTWFLGQAKIAIGGSSKLWGPFADNHQVWTVSIPPGESRKITVSAGSATEQEAAKVADAKPYEPPPPAPWKPEEGSREYANASYHAIVGPDGCLTSLKIGGEEFFAAGQGNPRGAYFWIDAPQQLTHIEQPATDVIVAQSDKASIRYQFGIDSMTWELSNLTAAPMQLLIVFDPGVNAVMDARGRYMKAPLERDWTEMTWFRGQSKLHIAGATRVWGPWGNNQQVLTVQLDPHDKRTVTLQPGQTSAAETAKVAEAIARVSKPPSDPVGPMWDMKALSKAPKVYPADGFDEKGVKAIFYEGRPYEGQPTRVFAWVGLPKMQPGKKVPAMVLVHGGGGTAFADWVRLWTSRGYAAIAMDTCGCVPKGTYGNWHHDPMGGPAGWGGFGQIDEPREDQWTYHAVADAILANSLLRSMPEVDPNRIGLTGISWGGYLTCIIAGADNRFRLAVPVYGCGYTLDMTFAPSVTGLGKERGDRWMRWWDPSVYLKDAHMPMLWVTGTNDFAYTFNALQKSYRLPKGPRTLCIRIRMPHGHGGPGENPEEIHALADNILMGADPLAKVTGQGRDGSQVWFTYASKVPLAKAELTFTKDKGPWPDRHWDATPAQIEADGKVTATLPEGTTVYYVNLIDQRNLIVSSEHVEMGQ
jgi:dienelactone hydrolase